MGDETKSPDRGSGADRDGAAEGADGEQREAVTRAMPPNDEDETGSPEIEHSEGAHESRSGRTRVAQLT